MPEKAQTEHAAFEPLLSWRAPSKSDHERSRRWYVVAGSLAALVVAYGVASSSWLLVILTAASIACFLVLQRIPHPIHSIGILPLGIQWNGRVLPWNHWKCFWILVGPDYAELHIAPTKVTGSDLVIQTGSIDVLRLQETLLAYLPQNANQQERILDAIYRFCKL